jgi:hypothetical protein
MADKELVIPVRMDSAPAEQGLHKLGAAGKKAADDLDAAFLNATVKIKGAHKESENLLKSMMEINVAEKAMEIGTDIVEAIGESMKAAAEKTKELAEEFIRVQKSMQEIAAMSGKPNTNKFTKGEIEKAAKANVTPEEWSAGRKAFMGQAQAFVGKGPGAKMSEEDADKLQASMAEYAKGKGVSAEAMSGMAGQMLAQEKGPISAKDMTAKVGKVYGTLEGAGGSPTDRMAGMQKLTALGYTAESAAQTLVAMKQIAPGREAMALQQMQMGVEEGITKGTIGKKQGVKEGMAPDEELKAVATYLHTKMEKGGNEEEQKKILNREVAAMTTSPRAKIMLQNLGRVGPAAFDQAEQRAKDVPDDEVEKQIAADRGTDPGLARHAEAHLAEAKSKTGEEYANVETLKKEAEARAEQEGALNPAAPGFIARGMTHALEKIPLVGPGLASPSPKDQVINEYALRMSREKAGLAPDPMPNWLQPKHYTATVDETVKENLKLAAENAENAKKRTEHAKKQTEHLAEIAAGSRPVLSAPPPRPETRH